MLNTQGSRILRIQINKALFRSLSGYSGRFILIGFIIVRRSDSSSYDKGSGGDFFLYLVPINL
jgi:hypothetical protein